MAPVTNLSYEPVSPVEPEPHSMRRGREPHGQPKVDSRVAEVLPSPNDSVWTLQDERRARTPPGGHGEKAQVKLGMMERLEETWIWETAGPLIAVLAFISGKSVSSWKMPIGPNALVGVFSTLSKAALMTVIPACISQLKWIHFSQSPRRLIDMQAYDDASRGPFGSLLFLHGLIVRKGRSKVSALTAVGCFITIVALALEPFTQQIISFRVREIELGDGQGTASLAVATAYDTGVSTRSGTWRREVMDQSMQGAILAGIFSQTIDTGAYEQCSTSNCSWPVASSLSICSSCQDVTASTTKNCSGTLATKAQICNYTTPARNELAAERGPGGSSTYYATYIDTSARFGSNTINDGAPAIISSVAMLRTRDPGNLTGSPNTYNAHIDECHFYWCKITYNENRIFANGSRISETSRELLNWDQSNRVPKVAVIDKGNTTSYPINVIDSSGIARMLQSLFSTSLIYQGYSNPVETEFSIAQLLYNTANFSSLMEYTASSMSARLRSGSGSVTSNVTHVRGTVMHTETYIHGSVSGMERIAVEKTALCDDFIKERRYDDAEGSHELRGRSS
ncbi:unnamed protein product [Clonostachys chloroleuca]|uniref:Uncharacterized protein n=1 Tax=Clonostachys chloroleuca TaxID=1926264 RepID=A0AA35MJH2_9HYPO|nr:unnamed protein product [Clonostachys chloroleuca]